MNHYKTDTNGALVNTTPLFASSWLALFYVLRESYVARRELAERVITPSRTDKK